MHELANRRILVLEDAREDKPRLRSVFRTIDPSIQIDWASSVFEARTKVGEKRILGSDYDYIFADMYLGDTGDSGADFLMECQERYPAHSLVLMSAQSLSKIKRDRAFSGRFHFIRKSPFLEDVVRQFKRVISLARTDELLHLDPEQWEKKGWFQGVGRYWMAALFIFGLSVLWIMV